MKVKVGDKVKILAGKDKGKEGTVVKTISKSDKVIVRDINMVKKHMKPNAMNETGGIVTMEAPIHVSNVKVLENDKKVKTVKTEEKKKTTKKAKNDEAGDK